MLIELSGKNTKYVLQTSYEVKKNYKIDISWLLCSFRLFKKISFV